MSSPLHLSTYVEPELKEALLVLARAAGRSLAGEMRQVLREYVRAGKAVDPL